MSVKKLRLGCKDFEERTKIYKLLSRVYVESKKRDRPLTQRQLINMAYDVGGYKLTEATFIKYVKEEKSK